MAGDRRPPVAPPLVSVIMPTFNDRDAIEEAIQSILDQTLDSWELIVVDDKSTDGTADFVESRFRDPRIRLIRMERNSGSGTCRNRAIEVSRGEFIAVMDADDVSLPERLRLQAGRLQEVPDLGVVSAQVLEFGTWGGPILGSWPTDSSEIAARQSANKMPVPHPAAMFRRSVLTWAGGYDISCRRAQDYSLFLNLSEVRLETLDEPLVCYRTSRPISLGYVIRNEEYAELARLRRKLKNQGVRNEDLPTTPRRSFRLYIRSVRSWIVRNAREQLELIRRQNISRRSS